MQGMYRKQYPEFKVILVGEYGVGKSSILRRFSHGTFLDTSGMDWHKYRESTIGLDNYCKQFECTTDSGHSKTISLRLFDTGGLERIGSVGTSYYKSSDAALLVFARNNLDSFNCLTQHLLEVLSSAENAKIFLVANKEDLNHKEVSDQEIQTFIEQFDKIEAFFKVSCKTNSPSVDELFCLVAKRMANLSSYRFANRYNEDVVNLNRSQYQSNYDYLSPTRGSTSESPKRPSSSPCCN